MRRRFFVERFEGATAALRGEAAEHLGRVLRAEPGQLYELSDGEKVWLARVEHVRRNAIEFALVEPLTVVEPSLRVTLLLSIVKFDRFEWCLEKATELGAAEILPLAAARSEKALVAAAAKRARRWEKILLESAQQSRRLRPPSLRAVARPDAAFASANAGVKILLSERPSAQPLRIALHEMQSSERRDEGAQRAVPIGPRRISMAIGPEGGWTDEELAEARSAGFVEASLGESILRTETAVIAALAIVNYALGD